MPWFKVDDNFAFHHKAVAAGNTALGLWARAGSWSADQLTDGFIPNHMVRTLGGRPADARRLVDVGLWNAVEGGYQFHQWGDDGRQPSRADVESKRAEWRERKARSRAAAQQAADLTAELKAALAEGRTRS